MPDQGQDDHGHDHDHPDPGSSGQFVANWRRSDASFGRKLWLVIRHRGLPHPFRLCCGRPGLPGC